MMLEDILNQYHHDLPLHILNTQKKSFEAEREGNSIFPQQLQHHKKSSQKNLLKKKNDFGDYQMSVLLFLKIRQGV